MKKLFLSFIAMMIATVGFAQTLKNSFNDEISFYVAPKLFTNEVVYPQLLGKEIDDIVIYNKDFTAVEKTITPFTSEYYRGYENPSTTYPSDIEFIDFDSYGAMDDYGQFYASQTLFNNDDLWEYAMTEYGEVVTFTIYGSEYKYSRVKYAAIYNENNEIIMKFTPTTQDDKVVVSYGIEKLFKMNGAYFIQINKSTLAIADMGREDSYDIWQFDFQETSVKKVSEVPARKDASVYDLNGRRYGNDIRSLRSGIYIQDGRKIIVE